MSNCDAKATEKKLAGAAKTSFVKKCEADAGAGGCEAKATEEAGRRGEGRASSRSARPTPRPMAACDAKAAEKKLAGAAKASFTKKCMADA